MPNQTNIKKDEMEMTKRLEELGFAWICSIEQVSVHSAIRVLQAWLMRDVTKIWRPLIETTLTASVKLCLVAPVVACAPPSMDRREGPCLRRSSNTGEVPRGCS